LTPSESYGATATDVNELGQSVGYSKDMQTRKMQAIKWERNGSYNYLTSGQYANTCARAINDKDQIVGTGEGTRKSGLFWENSSANPTEISAPSNWTEIVPLAINKSGQVVGYGRGSFWGHAFLYSNGEFTDLNKSDWENSFAMDINDNGEILLQVKLFGENDYRCFIWKNGVASEVINPYKITNISEINNLGQFVGECYYQTESGNKTYAFLATPVPEPATILLFGLGLLGLERFRKRFQ